MAIEAFVLPYLGRSAGVVFWQPTRAAAREPRQPRRRGAAGPPEPIEVYAPGPLSAGEAAELQAAFVASLGRAFGPRGRGGPTLWWWIAGSLAALLLALGALPLGPGYAWLALVAAVTALPFGISGAGEGLSRRDTLRARRLARHAGDLSVAPGADPRQQERMADLWRAGRRAAGAPARQLADLEAHCREHAWPAAAGFYAEQRRRLEAPAAPNEGRARWRRWLGRRGGRRGVAPAYAMVEMRAW